MPHTLQTEEQSFEKPYPLSEKVKINGNKLINEKSPYKYHMPNSYKTMMC
jgi:hypothetical protein